MISSRKNSLWAIILPDALLLYLSLYLAIAWRYHGQLASEDIRAHYQAFSIIFIFWLVVFFIHGLFEVTSFRRYTSLIFNLVSAMAVNLGVAITYFYFQPNLILTPRRFLLIQVAIAFVLLLLWHLL